MKFQLVDESSQMQFSLRQLLKNTPCCEGDSFYLPKTII